MIRLQRIGRKNDPSFRVVVVDSHQGPKSGKYVDLLGSYNPKMDTISLDGEKAKSWIGKGAQVSDTMHNILVKEGIISGKKKNVLPKKSPIVKEAKEEKSEDVAEEVATEDVPSEEKKEEETPEEAAEGQAPKEEKEEEKADVEEEKKEEVA